MPRRSRGIALAGVLVLAGCGLGGNETRESEQPRITRPELAAMVLPAEELGPLVDGLDPDGDAGFVGNGKAADRSFDPDDTGRSLRSAGRVTGYELSYEHPRLISVRPRKGVLAVGSSVEVLEDRVYAAQYLHALLSEYQTFGNALPGLKVSRYSTFEAAVGDEGGGQQARISIPGVVAGYETGVYFRRGRVVGSVGVVRADRRDARKEALRLAGALDRRIQAVLAGRLEVAPLRRDKKDDASAAALRRLPAQTLAPADVGPGAVPVDEGRLKDDDYQGYYRDFRDVVVGGSHLLTLRGTTELYETRQAADFAQTIRTKPVGRRIFAEAVVQAFADGTGVQPTNVRSRALANPGRGMSGMVVTFELVGAEFTMTAIFTRSGRLLQAVMGICRTDAFDPDDLKPVARRAREHLLA